MTKQAWYSWLLDIAVFAKVCDEAVLCEEPSLGETVHALADFEEDTVAMHKRLQAVFVNGHTREET